MVIQDHQSHKFNDITSHLSKGTFINSNPLPESHSRTIGSHPVNTIALILGIFQRLVPYVGSIEWSEEDLGTANHIDFTVVALSTEESFLNGTIIISVDEGSKVLKSCFAQAKKMTTSKLHCRSRTSHVL